jgi:putative transcriptional regulator
MKNRLKELRQFHKFSQADMAREIGVSRQAVNGFESGKFDPSLEMAFQIAKLFDVAIEDVFTYEAKQPMQTLVKQLKRYFGFERFAQKAVNAVKFAHNLATKSLHPKVEPEHLLIGLLADPTTTAAQLLRASGMTLNVEIDDHSFEARGNPKLSPHSESVMELALEIVQLKGKKSIGTEHLLWGLVRLAETENPELNELFQQYAIDLTILNDRLADKV